MADKETTQFEKVGDDGITSHVVNISGQRSVYTKPATKEGFGKSGTGDLAHKSNKSATMIHNANGPRCFIAATINYPNSPEASKEQKNVKRVQGPYSFELARAQAANTKNV